MNEKRESLATIDRKKKYPQCSQSKVTIGKNGVAYNNSEVARGRISPIFPNFIGTVTNIYTDASDFQLGAYIIQERRPVVYFLQKLTKSQQNYTTMEKEMLPSLQLLKNLKVCSSVWTFMFYES
jgi:hypothetical protein